tara:strand:- start:2331 stop:3275 length:945 start_codon:yes stop_codon:yes gene_type:complete
LHPALSVIFFTSASGAGYGLLIVIAFMAAFRLVPIEPVFGAVGLGFAFILVSTGLFSSTFHLGHPERAWRALSQWRTSWLSREGVLSIITFGPWTALTYVWFAHGKITIFGCVIALICVLFSILTIYSTAMIYRSLKTVHQWNNNWTIPVYLLLGLMNGVVFGAGVQAVTIGVTDLYILMSIFFVLISGLLKRQYWVFVDNSCHTVTASSATGFTQGQVRLLEGPHTEENYLLSEMGYKIARKHKIKIRKLAVLFGFFIPSVMLVIGLFSFGLLQISSILVASVSAFLGVFFSRWLFFAEARHVVTLYYGAEKA